MSAAPSPRAAHLGMLLWALLVGLSFPAVGAMSELPPLSLTALRFAIAGAALWWLARRGPSFLPAPGLLPLYALMGLCLAGFFGAMFWAAHHATALSMATLYVTVPLLAFLLGQAGGLRLGRGEAVFFLGCLASALYPVLSKWGLASGRLPESAAVRTFWSLALGALLIGLAGLAIEPVGRLAAMTGRDLALLVYLGLFSSALTFWLLQRATAALTPGAVTAYGYLVPFVSMLLLFVQVPERIGWVWLPGSLLVLLAIGLLLRDGQAASAKAQGGSSTPSGPA